MKLYISPGGRPHEPVDGRALLVGLERRAVERLPRPHAAAVDGDVEDAGAVAGGTGEEHPLGAVGEGDRAVGLGPLDAALDGGLAAGRGELERAAVGLALEPLGRAARASRRRRTCACRATACPARRSGWPPACSCTPPRRCRRRRWPVPPAAGRCSRLAPSSSPPLEQAGHQEKHRQSCENRRRRIIFAPSIPSPAAYPRPRPLLPASCRRRRVPLPSSENDFSSGMFGPAPLAPARSSSGRYFSGTGLRLACPRQSQCALRRQVARAHELGLESVERRPVRLTHPAFDVPRTPAAAPEQHEPAASVRSHPTMRPSYPCSASGGLGRRPAPAARRGGGGRPRARRRGPASGRRARRRRPAPSGSSRRPARRRAPTPARRRPGPASPAPRCGRGRCRPSPSPAPRCRSRRSSGCSPGDPPDGRAQVVEPVGDVGRVLQRRPRRRVGPAAEDGVGAVVGTRA